MANAPVSGKAYSAAISTGAVTLLVTVLIASVPWLKQNIPTTAIPAIVTGLSTLAALVGAYVAHHKVTSQEALTALVEAEQLVEAVAKAKPNPVLQSPPKTSRTSSTISP